MKTGESRGNIFAFAGHSRGILAEELVLKIRGESENN